MTFPWGVAFNVESHLGRDKSLGAGPGFPDGGEITATLIQPNGANAESGVLVELLRIF